MRRSLFASIVLSLLATPFVSVASNDTLFSRQWGLRQIDADRAWPSTRGRGAMIAIIDTGVDLGHADLAAHVSSGYDYVGNDARAQDDEGHGTHVAGIAGAIRGNSRGVSGVAPEASILAVKVLDRNGDGTGEDVARGIRFAAGREADVINLSLSEQLPLDELRIPEVDSAIRHATARGSVVIAAAGNESFPFASRETADIALLVGATSRSDIRASYSNSGSGVRIWAPGGDIVQGLFCSNDSGIWSTYLRGKGNCQDDYDQLDGTSMAAPHVAGTAALIRSVNPAFSPARVIDILISTTERTFDGLPRLNAARAVGKARSLARVGGTAAGGGGASGGSGGVAGPRPPSRHAAGGSGPRGAVTKSEDKRPSKKRSPSPASGPEAQPAGGDGGISTPLAAGLVLLAAGTSLVLYLRVGGSRR